MYVIMHDQCLFIAMINSFHTWSIAFHSMNSTFMHESVWSMIIKINVHSLCRNFCLSVTSTRSRWRCEGPCPPSFPASDLQPCRLSASKHNGLQILELDLLHAYDLRKATLENWLCRSILQQWQKLYQYNQTMLPTGRTCQIGNGERTGTVSQSTFEGRVKLRQKERESWCTFRKGSQGFFWRAAHHHTSPICNM